MKRRLKAEEKAKKKAEKLAAAPPSEQPSQKKKEDSENIDANEYIKLRSAAVSKWKAAGESPYPHKFHVSISLTEFIDKYQNLADGEHHSDAVSVAGMC